MPKLDLHNRRTLCATAVSAVCWRPGPEYYRLSHSQTYQVIAVVLYSGFQSTSPFEAAVALGRQNNGSVGESSANSWRIGEHHTHWRAPSRRKKRA